MNTKQFFKNAALLLMMATPVLFTACSKDNENNGDNGNPNTEIPGGKRVAKIIFDNREWIFDYDKQGRIVSWKIDYLEEENDKYDEFIKIEYQADGSIKYSEGDYSIIEKLNAAGYVESSTMISESGQECKWIYFYNEDNTLKQAKGKQDMVFVDEEENFSDVELEFTYNYSWTDGNITALNSQTVWTTGIRGYNDMEMAAISYSDKLNNSNLDLSLFLNPELLRNYGYGSIFGFTGKKCKNLPSKTVRTYNGNEFIYEFSYLFDSDGYLIQAVTSRGYTYTVEYVK